MMRYSIILVAACLPLAAITAWSTLELLLQPPDAGEAVGKDFKEASKLSTEVIDRAANDRATMDQFENVSQFESRTQEFGKGNTVVVNRVVDAWQRVQEAGVLLSRVGAIGAQSSRSKPTKVEIEKSLDEVKRFLSSPESQAGSTVEGSSSLFTALERHRERLERELKSLEARALAEKTVAEGEGHLRPGNAISDQTCLSVLSRGFLATTTDPELRARIIAAREIANYRIAWRKMDKQAKAIRTKSPREAWQLYEDFFKAHPLPPTDRERLGHERALAAQVDLEREAIFMELPQSADLATLFSLADRLAQVNLAQVNVNLADVRNRVRAAMKTWFQTVGFPEKIPPDWLRGCKEAETKSDRRLIGLFELPDGVEQYRYWPDAKSHKSNPRGDMQIAKDDLRQAPGKPKYLQMADEYNDSRIKVIRQEASKSEWDAFAKRCEEMQREYTAYRDRWGSTSEADAACGNWEFYRQAVRARELVAQWSRYQTIINSPPTTSESASSN